MEKEIKRNSFADRAQMDKVDAQVKAIAVDILEGRKDEAEGRSEIAWIGFGHEMLFDKVAKMELAASNNVYLRANYDLMIHHMQSFVLKICGEERMDTHHGMFENAKTRLDLERIASGTSFSGYLFKLLRSVLSGPRNSIKRHILSQTNRQLESYDPHDEFVQKSLSDFDAEVDEDATTAVTLKPGSNTKNNPLELRVEVARAITVVRGVKPLSRPLSPVARREMLDHFLDNPTAAYESRNETGVRANLWHNWTMGNLETFCANEQKVREAAFLAIGVLTDLPMPNKVVLKTVMPKMLGLAQFSEMKPEAALAIIDLFLANEHGLKADGDVEASGIWYQEMGIYGDEALALRNKMLGIIDAEKLKRQEVIARRALNQTASTI